MKIRAILIKSNKISLIIKYLKSENVEDFLSNQSHLNRVG
jgi:hypothetical protein